MFGKKNKCQRCGGSVKSSYDFCPNCGLKLKESKQEWGMLGKNDSFSSPEMNLPLGFNTIFNSLAKNLDKQFREMEEEMRKNALKNNKNLKPKNKQIPPKGISIKISTSKNQAPEIKISSFGEMQKPQEAKREIISKRMKEDSLRNLKNLPREEPKTNIRRLSDKVVYEIIIPGVESSDDISINRLENSIEVKAIAKDRIYTKNLPFALPIIDFKFDKGKLTLELDAEE